jgi:hypothetical protein
MRQIVFSHRLGGRLTAKAPGVLAASLADSSKPATVDAQARLVRLSGVALHDAK